MNNENLPPLKEPYKLKEQEQKIVDRIKEELDYRLKTDVVIDIYTENFLVHPTPYFGTIKVEIIAGNWKRINAITQIELELNQGEAFYYFMRRCVDETMQDLLIRGSRTF